MAQAGTIPTSIKDETGAIARREAEANDKLAQLFYTLLARRMDRERAEALQLKMFGLRNAEWDRRDAITSSRTGQAAYTPSTGAHDGSMGTATPAPVAPANDGSTMGDTPILNPDTFSMNTSGGSNTMVGGAGMDAMAQASPEEAAAAKADAKVHPRGAAKTPTTSLPAAKRKPAPQVVFRGVTPEVLAEWSKAEKQNGIPEGQLLMTYGMETGGGRNQDNPDPNRGPKGPFQWTPQLLRQNGLTVQDAYDLVKMGHATAKNMAHNHSEMVRRTTLGGRAVQLTDSVNDMRNWHWLHQFGVKGGPALVAAVKLNPTMKMIEVLDKLGLKDANGKPLDFGRVLTNNGYHGEATIAEGQKILESRMHPWRTAAVQGKGLDTSGQPTQQSQAVPAGPQVAGGEQPPRPPADVPNAGMQGRSLTGYLRGKPPEHVTGLGQMMQQRLQAMFDAAPPEIRKALGIISGYRSPEHQAKLWNDAVRKYGSPEAARKWVAPPGGSEHGRGNATDLHYGTPAARQWVHNNARQFGLKFPLGHEPWHVEALETRGGPKFAGQLPQRTQVAQAPAKPTEASSQARRPLTEYPRPSPKPSETNVDVTGGNIFAGAAVTPKGAPQVAATPQAPQAPSPGSAQAKPTPTPPSLPPGIRPQTPYTAPPNWPTGQEPAVPVQPGALPGIDALQPHKMQQAQPLPDERIPMPRPRYISDPTTVPQDLPFEANYPQPEQVPLPQPRPNFEARGAQSVDEGGFEQAYPLPPADLTMGGGSDYTGAQSFDEAGMMPVMAMPTASEYDQPRMDFAAGNEYAPPAMATPGTGEFSPDVMATPGVAEFGGDVMATPETGEFSGDVMAAAPGNEFAPPPKLPGANLTMPTPGAGPPQPAADYMTLQQRIGWPSGEERFKMQNDVRNALFARTREAFSPDPNAAQPTPPVADIPLPPEGGGEGGPAPTRDVADAIFGSNKPNPMHGIAKPYVDNVLQSIIAKAKEYQQGARAITPPTAASAPNAAAIIKSVLGAGRQAFTQPMPQLGNIQFGSPAQGEGDAEAPIPMSRRGAAPPPPVTSQPQQQPTPQQAPAPSAEQDTTPGITPQTLVDVFKRTVPGQVAGYAAQGIGKGVDAISEMFKSKPSAATAKPSPAAAPLAGKPVKVERFRNGLPVGSDDKIEIPPMPGRTTTSTTPIPYDTAAPAAGAAKPPMPAAPKAGAGAKPLGDKNSYRSWKLPDGRIVHTKPGEDPPAGAQQVK